MYSKTTWKDRVVDPDTGAVVQEGTFMSAEHFNNMENGIAANDSAISTINGDIDDIEETLDTGVGTTISLTINQSTFVMKLALKNSEGTTLSEQSIDLPIESMVVNAEYVEATKSLVLTLQSGSTVTVPLSALINGLVNDTRKVAGIDLKDDITVSEMKTALGVDVLEQNKVDKTTVSAEGISETTATITVPAKAKAVAVQKMYGKTVKITPESGDPYLANAANESVVSVGRNIFDGKYNFHTLINGTSGSYISGSSDNTYSAIIKCKPSTTYDIYRDTANSNRLRVASYSVSPTNGTTCISGSLRSAYEGTGTNPIHYEYTTPSGAEYMVVYVSSESKQPKMTVKVKDDITESYVPYFTHTAEIPISLTSLADYGCSVPRGDGTGTIYNWIDFENGLYYHNVDYVELSDYEWTYRSSDGLIYTNLSGFVKAATDTTLGNILVSSYGTTTRATVFTNKDNFAIPSTGSICIASSVYTSAATFRNAMKGVYAVYERATPEVIDISDIIRPLKVESGGTVTFVNPHNIDCDTVVKYKKEV